VKIGSAIRDVQLRIADSADSELDAGKVGHVQVLGASVARRIYGDASACANLFTGDGWLRTGDCGVIVDGKLVITGRSKDIIIVNGQNYYPHDIEEIASRVSGLDLGKVVVAGSRSSDGETEELLVFVLYRQDIQTFPRVVEAVRASIGEQTGLAVDHVIPVSKIPKTTSGKIQRAKLLDAYLDGEYDAALRQLSCIMIPAEVDADPRVAELETIAKEIVRTLPIGPDVNLFEAGLDSLELTEIILAIEDRHPGKFQAIDVFDHPTLRGIADFIAHRN
jgi:acyl carrier protein